MTDELEKLRRENAQLREELDRTREEQEQFAYVASHDMQEPLRMVSNYVSLLEEEYKGQLDSDARMYIDFAVDGVKRMRKLIAALLDFSRVGRNQKFLRVSADDALDDAIVNLEASIEESGAVITKDPLPEVDADPDMLAVLFQNLISNAIKFRKKGVQPRVHVSSRCRRDIGRVVFSVRDEGIGLDTQFSDRIFIIFQRLHQERNGTGIGLAICKKIVESHGGSIWVESEPDQGATFLFTLRCGGQVANGQDAENTLSGGQPGGRGAGSEGADDCSSDPSLRRVRWRRSLAVPTEVGTAREGASTRFGSPRLELAASQWPRGSSGSQK